MAVDTPIATELLENDATVTIDGTKRYLRLEYLGKGYYSVMLGAVDGKKRTFLIKS